MDQRFDWFPTLKNDFLYPLASEVSRRIDQKRSRQGSSPEQLEALRDKESRTIIKLLSALYQAHLILPKGSARVSIPLTPLHYSKAASPNNYSYRVVKRVFENLEQLGWIDVIKGVEVKGVTRMWASGQLKSSFDDIGLVWLLQEVKSMDDLVVLRNFKNPEGKYKKARGAKVVMDAPETMEVDDYRTRLHEYNSFLVRHCVALDVDDDQLSIIADTMRNNEDKNASNDTKALNLSGIQLRRMFSRGSMQKGGRFFGGWWQSIPSLYRPHITIDGYQTVEIDYSSMALRVIYAQRGHPMPADVDLYDIGLDDWEGSLDKRRDPIKTYVNAILNDESGLYRLTKDELKIIGLTQKELKQKLHERHEAISDLFNSGVGMDAQFIESKIASLVMSKMLYEEILVLPIHDSFIVRKGYTSLLNDTMKEAFEEITGAKASVDQVSSRSRENFGIKIFKSDIKILPLAQVYDDMVTNKDNLMKTYLRSWKTQQLSP